SLTIPAFGFRPFFPKLSSERFNRLRFVITGIDANEAEKALSTRVFPSFEQTQLERFELADSPAILGIIEFWPSLFNNDRRICVFISPESRFRGSSEQGAQLRLEGVVSRVQGLGKPALCRAKNKAPSCESIKFGRKGDCSVELPKRLIFSNTRANITFG